MLGILHLLVSGGILAYGNGKNKAIDKRNKETMRIKGTNLYRDHDLVARDLKTNNPHMVYSDGSGDKITWDLKTNQKVNVSQNERNAAYDRAVREKPEGVTAVMIEKNDRSRAARDRSYVIGHRYKDIESGRIYVVRHMRNIRFYMDVETHELIRPINNNIEMDCHILGCIKEFKMLQENGWGPNTHLVKGYY